MLACTTGTRGVGEGGGGGGRTPPPPDPQMKKTFLCSMAHPRHQRTRPHHQNRPPKVFYSKQHPSSNSLPTHLPVYAQAGRQGPFPGWPCCSDQSLSSVRPSDQTSFEVNLIVNIRAGYERAGQAGIGEGIYLISV